MFARPIRREELLACSFGLPQKRCFAVKFCIQGAIRLTGSAYSKEYVLHKVVVAGLLGMFCCKCPQSRFLKLTGRPKAERCFLRPYKPRVISGVIRRDYLVGVSIRPPTPHVISYPLRPPPINWAQKGNKKPRVAHGVQILKDKRLG